MHYPNLIQSLSTNNRYIIWYKNAVGVQEVCDNGASNAGTIGNVHFIQNEPIVTITLK